MTETFLQHHGWVLVSLLGGLLVTLMFIMGANIHLVNYHLGALQKQAILKATGRKWLFAFVALVVLGVTVYAAFPLFFRVAFWGARWLWTLLLLTLFLQLLAYAICSRTDKPLGSSFFCILMLLNGILAPLIVGTFIGTFFTGAGFSVDEDGMISTENYKYFMNMLHHNPEMFQFVLGGLIIFAGLFFALKKKSHRKGFWFTVAGTVLVVMGVCFLAGFHGTPYFPSVTSPQSSLTLRNSSAGFETLHALFWVSLLIPVSIIGLGCVWHRVDHKKKVKVRRQV